jgi:hypothetical protein
VLRFFLSSLAASPPRISISSTVSLRTGNEVVWSLLLSLCAKYVCSDYSGGSPVSILWRLFSAFPPCNGENAAAAPSSRIVAAFAPLRWLLPCFPPFTTATIPPTPPTLIHNEILLFFVPSWLRVFVLRFSLRIFNQECSPAGFPFSP